MATHSATSVLLPRKSCMMDNFIIIWLDLSMNELDDFVNQLHQSTLYSIYTFDEPDSCVDFLSEIQYEKVFFIVAASLARTVVPLIHNMHQVYHIYISGNKLFEYEQEWRKIKGVFTDISSISNTLRRNIHQYEQNTESISVIPTDINDNLNELDSSFMYSQLLKEMLLEIKYDQQAKAQFVKFCQDKYSHSVGILHAIDNFEQNYYLHSPIWWYTKEPFIYLVLNRALRLQNIDVILKMGFFIQDLHRQIEQLYSKKNQTADLTLYRGQGMSNTEFEKLKKNEGGLLAFNNFLSTSYDEEVSIAFATSASDDPELIGILFRIQVSPLVASAPFASLDSISYYSDSEKETLFCMHTIFRISYIKQIQNRIWQVQLALTSDHDEQLQRLTERIRYETRGQVGNYRLGTLMIKMGDFQKAELFFKTLIEQTSDNNWELLSHLYNQMGFVYKSIGNYPNALAYLDKALHAKLQYLSPNHLDCATTYSNIATVYEVMGNYSTALSYFQKTLEIQEKSLPSIHSDLGTTYNNIGLVHRSNGDASNALLYFQKSLEIQQQSLPPSHPDLALTYGNIGAVYQVLGKYSTALSYVQRALNMQEKSLPPTHPHLAMTYANIGIIYDAMGDYNTALSYYQKTLNIHEKVLPSSHPDLAVMYGNLAGIYYSIENYMAAVEYYKKSIKIQEKIVPQNHPSLATTYNNIGSVYNAINEPSIALSYYKKTLEIEEKYLSPMHPTLATTYNNIGMAHDTMKDYATAISYYEQALEIYLKNYSPDHPDLADVYNNIGVANYQIADHETAIKFCKKALEIREKSLPATHPDIARAYNNIGVNYGLIGEYSSALIYFEKALQILEKALPLNYLLLASVHYSMAKTFGDFFQYSEAIEHTLRAIDAINQSKEPNSPQKQKYQDYLNELRQKI